MPINNNAYHVVLAGPDSLAEVSATQINGTPHVRLVAQVAGSGISLLFDERGVIELMAALADAAGLDSLADISFELRANEQAENPR